MRASVLATGRRLPARARVKVSRSDHFRRQPGRQPACMHCMHKNRLNFSDLSRDHACRILAGWVRRAHGHPRRARARGSRMGHIVARASRSKFRKIRAPQCHFTVKMGGRTVRARSRTVLVPVGGWLRGCVLRGLSSQQPRWRVASERATHAAAVAPPCHSVTELRIVLKCRGCCSALGLRAVVL